ncbi:SGNH/GDSL hydrolase family protein [Ciceribacter naphthalenivorans]|uniref:SGNH hydrolase-type esterase domain-containing protein n=3 Tax=Alphaproteobacteria TaxID=28211 RepID=A0A512HKU2_9HYPH|nr:hypothetical protein RNA01_29990 [Ciceribacter naphthalenivorans]GLR22154.1 hypothetical protein GCM10007920_19410 [Ciceribacter naphthalenivorans]GLT05010.1 hypothetical protein GCM10007926_19410 [Sphingomonas psychrolutea]
MREAGRNTGARGWLAGAFALALIAVCVLATEVEAQQSRQPRNLLELLFGRREQRYPEPPPPRKIQTPRAVKKQTKSITSITTAPSRPQPSPKIESAHKVLVVGDFVADGLASGLDEAFAASPGVVIDEHSNGSSGLVRTDYFDWQAQLPAMIAEVKPAVVIVEIGANDRQQMTTSSGKLNFRTDEWFQEYERRVTAFGKIVTDAKIPLLWVGLPAFRPQNMTADALTLNAIYRRAVERIGGEFIDVWDGFVDQDGRFIITGSDINGQQVRLRGSDGINLTAAGKRKLAFYAEKSARRLLGDMTSPDLVRLDGSNLPELLSLPPSEMQNVVKTQPMDLFDPELDGATELLGATPLPVATMPTPREQLVKNGSLPPPPAGRVDDLGVPQPDTLQK